MNRKPFDAFRVFIVFFALSSAFAHLPCPEAQEMGEVARSSSRDIRELARNMLASCDLLEEGKALYNKGDYARARTKFEKAVKKDPGNKNALKYLDMCDKITREEYSTGEAQPPEPKEKETPAEGFSLFGSMLKKFEQRIESLEKKKSMEAAEEKRKQEAAKAQEEMMKKQKEKIKVATFLINEGDGYYEREEYEKAYQTYKEALAALQSQK